MPQINYSNLRRAARLVLALTAGTLTGHLLHIPMSGWIMVTTAVVLFDQETVGGTINRGSLRLMATLSGAAISLLCLILFKDNWYIIWPVIGLSTFTYGYVYMGTKKSYIGVLGSVTVAILLISGQPSLLTACYRLMDILLGVTFALLSMLVFFPEYAVNKARLMAIKSIRDITELIAGIQNPAYNLEQLRQIVLRVETKFIGDVINFNKVIDEARYELKGRKHPELIERYSKCVLQIRRLYRLIIVIFYYQMDNHHLGDAQINPIWQTFLRILQQIIQPVPLHSVAVDYLELEQLISQIPEVTLQQSIHHLAVELRKLDHLLSEDT